MNFLIQHEFEMTTEHPVLTERINPVQLQHENSPNKYVYEVMILGSCYSAGVHTSQARIARFNLHILRERSLATVSCLGGFYACYCCSA